MVDIIKWRIYLVILGAIPASACVVGTGSTWPTRHIKRKLPSKGPRYFLHAFFSHSCVCVWLYVDCRSSVLYIWKRVNIKSLTLQSQIDGFWISIFRGLKRRNGCSLGPYCTFWLCTMQVHFDGSWSNNDWLSGCFYLDSIKTLFTRKNLHQLRL